MVNHRTQLIILTVLVIIFLIAMTPIQIRFNSTSIPNKSNSNSSNNVADFLNSLKDTSSSLILFLVSVSILVAILMSIGIFFSYEIRNPIILPFNTNDQNSLESKAITDAITTDLMKITEVLNKSEQVLQTDQALLSIQGILDIPGLISNLNAESSAFVNSLEGAKLSASGIELLIAPLLSLILQKMKLGDKGCIIRGSFQKYGENCFASAFVKTRTGEFACEVEGSYDKLPDLIKDLAFKIVFNLKKSDNEDKNKKMKNNEHQDQSENYTELQCKTQNHSQAQNYINKPELHENYETYVEINKDDVISNSLNDILKPFSGKIPNEIRKLENIVESLRKEYGNRDSKCEKKYTYFFDRKDPLMKNIAIEDLKKYNQEVCRGVGKSIAEEDLEKYNQEVCKAVDRPLYSVSDKNRDEEIKKRKLCEIQRIKNKNKTKKNEYHLNRLLIEYNNPKLKSTLRINSSEELKFFADIIKKLLKYKDTENAECLNLTKENFVKIKEKNNRLFIGLFYNLGLAYLAENKYEDADGMFAKAIEINPNAASFCGRGFCKRYLGHWKDAIDEFENAVSYDRDLALPWNLLGYIYFDLGCYSSDLYDYSIASFNEALMREPEFPYSWLFLSLIYRRKLALLPKDEKSRCPKDRNLAKIYNKIALDCIERSLCLSKSYGYTELFPIQLDHRDILVRQKSGSSEVNCDNLEGERHSSYLLKKDPRNRASQASLRGRNEEALKYLNEALRGENRGPMDILFDPDFEKMKKDEDTNLKLKELLKNYQVKEEILEDIRDIISNEELYDDDYIRASFEAACDFKLKAIEILRSKPKKLEEYEMRYEEDPHFESINDLAVIVSVEKKPVPPGSNISLDLMIIKTCEVPLHNVYVTIQLPKGLILDSNYRENNSSYDFISRKLMKPLKPFPKGRWEERAVHQEILVDGVASGKIPIKVRVVAKKNGKKITKICDESIIVNPAPLPKKLR